MTDIITKKLHY